MRIIRSLKCAARGIKHCAKNERNMRIHLVTAVYVILFSGFFNFSINKIVILLLTVSAVITAEMVNTAVEGISDIAFSEYNSKVRAVKDIAAGSVLVTCVFSVIIGVLLFSDYQCFVNIFVYFVDNPLMIIPLLFSAVFGVIYILWGSNGIKTRFRFLTSKNRKSNK